MLAVVELSSRLAIDGEAEARLTGAVRWEIVGFGTAGVVKGDGLEKFSTSIPLIGSYRSPLVAGLGVAACGMLIAAAVGGG